MSAADDLELMQHADGELDETLDAKIRARIEKDVDSRTKVESLAQVSELVRGHLELSSDELLDRRFQSMWRNIDKALDAEPKTFWSRVSGWFERYRGHVITGMVSAGAVAALAIVLRPGSSETPRETGFAPISVQPAALRSAPSIESLDTPGGTGTVLNLEDEDGNTAVIWVTPEDTVEGI